ncbi:MAG: hypothetical protein KDA33_01700 [Phycisphaerales bacterium]|nr:hypothetical protein [Phycisphaerales bacterium]
MDRHARSFSLFIAMTLALCVANGARGQMVDDTFTYQGQLKLEGQNVNGDAQFAFYLWDAETGGNVVGTPLAMEAAIVDGVFTVDLDFDAPDFNGDIRWLEIAVRYPSGVGSYTFLTPRQALRATPYAVTALQAQSVAGLDGHSLDAADGTPTDALFVDNAGEVGIGTLNPLAPLDIRNDWATLRLQAETAGASTFIDMRRSDGSVRGIVGVDGPGFSGPKDQLSIATWTSHPIGFFTGAAQRMVIDNTGNVGIGVTTPSRKLQVVGTARVGVLEVGGNFPTQGMLIDQDHIDTIQGDPLFLQAQSFGDVIVSRNLGVGTTSPGVRLDVESSESSATTAVIRNTSSSGNGGAWLDCISDSGTLEIGINNSTHLDPGTSVLNATADLKFITGGAERMRIKNDGRVGIGTSVPEVGAKLDVEGVIRCEAVILDGGADLSEGFCVDETARPGMVVAIDPSRPGALRTANTPYDVRVAGVISGAGGVKPGLRMGQADTIADGDHPVALTGRVFCWCDADANGPIEVGDMLTTSATAGHAMRASDRDRAFGATIGKAMTPLERGRGLVLVLVNLH